MDFYIFNKKGNYIGMRGIAPTEADLVGIEATEENIAKMNTPFEHILVNGEIVNGDPLPVPVPEVITPAQFWRSVYRVTGLTEDSIISQIEATIPEPPKVEILILLRKATQFERNSPELLQMASNFGIDEKTLDQIFITASNYIL